MSTKPHPLGDATYNPHQLEHVVRWLPREPRWLVLGGPSQADEAQTAKRLWPAIEVIAFEPVERMREWQARHGFLGRMIPRALWHEETEVEMWGIDGPTGSSVLPLPNGARLPDRVRTTTLDIAERQFGPFEDALLWLDIEGAELEALQGGRELLASGRVLLINVETCDRELGARAAIGELLKGCGYHCAERWNSASGAHHDEVWIK